MKPKSKAMNKTKRKKYLSPQRQEAISLKSYRFLEELLSFFVSRKEINTIIRNLFHNFDNELVNIFSAPVEELVKVQGIDYNIAVYLSRVPEIVRRYNIEMVSNSKVTVPFENIKEFLVAYYSTFTVEVVVLLCLNNRLEIISDHEIYHGSVNSANVNTRKMIEIAFFQNASSIVLAHNHPNGFAVPSPEDMDTTKRVYSIVNSVDLELTEHYIVSGEICYPVMEHIKKQFIT